MIYQEMYGYFTIENPREQAKVWDTLSPQLKDYIEAFHTMLGDMDNPPLYERSKFYRLITKEEFDSLLKVFYETQNAIMEAAFEKEFRQAFLAYEKIAEAKAELKAKMNEWRAELDEVENEEWDEVANEESPIPTPPMQEPIFLNRRRMMMESEELDEPYSRASPQSSRGEGNSAGGCLIAIVAGVLILITLFFFRK